MYGVYDMKNNEICVGVFKRTKEIAEYFNTTDVSIRTANLYRKALRDCRYKIVKINE